MKMLDTLLSGNYDDKSIAAINEKPVASNSDLTDTIQQENSILTQ